MKKFRYTAKDYKGEDQKGVVYANTQDEAMALIKGKNLIPLDVKTVFGFDFLKFQVFSKRIKQEELVIFTHQFATLINSGLTLIQAIDALIDQSENLILKEALAESLEDIKKGETLSNSFNKFPGVFPSIYIQLLKVAEASGNLDKILSSLAVYLERQHEIRQKIRSGLAYPKFASTIVLLVVVFLIAFILPRFTGLYMQAGVELPAPTKALLFISQMFKNYWLAIIGIIMGLYLLLKRFYKTTKGRKIFDKTVLKIPIFGKITYIGALARFSKTLSLMLKSGVSLIDSLNLSSKTLENVILETAVIKAKDHIQNGDSISIAFKKSQMFPPLMYRMINIGEESGSLDELLDKIGDFWESELDHKLKRLASQIEPAMIIVLGVVVAFIAVAMYLPMFDMVRLYRTQR